MTNWDFNVQISYAIKNNVATECKLVYGQNIFSPLFNDGFYYVEFRLPLRKILPIFALTSRFANNYLIN